MTKRNYKRIRGESPGGVVMVVGRDRSVPALLKLLGHPEEIKIAPNEYDNLFIVLPKEAAPPVVLRLRY